MTVQQPAGAIRTIGLDAERDVTFSPDGTRLYTAHAGTITAYDVASGNVVGTWTLGSKLGAIDVSLDGRYLVALDQQPGVTTTSGYSYATEYRVYRLDLATGGVETFVNRAANGDSYFYDVVVLPSGKALLTQNYNGSGWLPLTTLDFTTGTFAAQPGSYSQDGALTASPDRKHVLFGPQNISSAPVYIYTEEAGITASRGVYQDNVSGFNNGIQAISADGKLSVQGSTMIVYDGTLRIVTRLSERYSGLYPAGLTFNRAGDRLYLLNAETRHIYALDTSTWDIVASFPVGADVGDPAGSYSGGRGFGNSLTLSADGRYLSVIGSSLLQVIDLSKVISDGGTSFADSVTGDIGAEVIYGFEGNDLLDGGPGADTLYGGRGDDRFVVDNLSDRVYEYALQGDDLILASVSYALPSDVEALTLTGTAAINGTGNDVANVITGNDAINTLAGAGGRDTLIGGGGADILIGGAGADILTGGQGNDIFFGTMTELAGDRITDLSVGDRIGISGVDSAAFTFRRVGGSLTFGTTTIDIGTADVRLTAAAARNGVELIATSNAKSPSDFDGNGHSDLLWRNRNGTFATWQVSGTPVGNQFEVNATVNGTVDPTWQIQETFDWNGDGRADIFWRNAQSGQFTVWTGGAKSFTANAYSNSTVGIDWKVAALGDLNGDGRDDIVWRQDDGGLTTWLSTGSGFTQNAYQNVFSSTRVDPIWKVVGLADFNGDGREDILWRNSSTGMFTEWQSNGTGFVQNVYVDGTVGTDWHVDALADFNGDGKDDILWRQDGSGTFTVWQSLGDRFAPNTYVNGTVASGWQVATTGDFNADGRADILWRNTASGDFSTWQSNGNGFDPNSAFVPGVGTDWQVQGHDFKFG